MRCNICLALAEWQSSNVNLWLNRPTCGDTETHVFAHKLPCMHAHACTGTKQKKTHTQAWWVLATYARDISSHTHTQTGTFSHTDTNTCHCNSHDHSLHMKETGDCQSGRKLRPHISPAVTVSEERMTLTWALLSLKAHPVCIENKSPVCTRPNTVTTSLQFNRWRAAFIPYVFTSFFPWELWYLCQ